MELDWELASDRVLWDRYPGRSRWLLRPVDRQCARCRGVTRSRHRRNDFNSGLRFRYESLASVVDRDYCGWRRCRTGSNADGRRPRNFDRNNGGAWQSNCGGDRVRDLGVFVSARRSSSNPRRHDLERRRFPFGSSFYQAKAHFDRDGSQRLMSRGLTCTDHPLRRR